MCESVEGSVDEAGSASPSDDAESKVQDSGSPRPGGAAGGPVKLSGAARLPPPKDFSSRRVVDPPLPISAMVQDPNTLIPFLVDPSLFDSVIVSSDVPRNEAGR